MKGLIIQDTLIRWYMPVLWIALMLMFCSYFVIFRIPALIVLAWFPVLWTCAFSGSGETLTHFGSYAICSHAVSREQYMRSKYTIILISLIISAVYTAVMCFVFRDRWDLMTMIIDLLMSSAMCLFGFTAYMMMAFKTDLDDRDLYALIPLTLAAIIVLILVFWPGNTMLMFILTAAAIIGTVICYRRSCVYVRTMNM